MSCADRRLTLEVTLEGLKGGGWRGIPEVVLDDGLGEDRLARITRTWQRMLQQASQAMTDYVLLLEDDLIVGKWFAHNLLSWSVLREPHTGGAFFGSLYNPGRPFLRRNREQAYLVASADAAWGGQALVMTPQTVRYVVAHWDEALGNPDQRMPRLAARVTPIYFHLPSLVDHAPVPTTWGGIEHTAIDFDPDWRAPGKSSSAGHEAALSGS